MAKSIRKHSIGDGICWSRRTILLRYYMLYVQNLLQLKKPADISHLREKNKIVRNQTFIEFNLAIFLMFEENKKPTKKKRRDKVINY